MTVEDPLRKVVALAEKVKPTGHPLVLWRAIDKMRRTARVALPAADGPGSSANLSQEPADLGRRPVRPSASGGDTTRR